MKKNHTIVWREICRCFFRHSSIIIKYLKRFNEFSIIIRYWTGPAWMSHVHSLSTKWMSAKHTPSLLKKIQFPIQKVENMKQIRHSSQISREITCYCAEQGIWKVIKFDTFEQFLLPETYANLHIVSRKSKTKRSRQTVSNQRRNKCFGTMLSAICILIICICIQYLQNGIKLWCKRMQVVQWSMKWTFDIISNATAITQCENIVLPATLMCLLFFSL